MNYHIIEEKARIILKDIRISTLKIYLNVDKLLDGT